MPGAIAKVTRNYQVSIPKYVRQALGIKIGDMVSFDVQKNGKTLISPIAMIKKEQSYYWSPKWQKEMKQSEEDLRKGHFKSFQTVKELKKHFHDK